MELWIYEKIIFIRYTWHFIFRGGKYANEYLRGANAILREIQAAKECK